MAALSPVPTMAGSLQKAQQTASSCSLPQVKGIRCRPLPHSALVQQAEEAPGPHCPPIHRSGRNQHRNHGNLGFPFNNPSDPHVPVQAPLTFSATGLCGASGGEHLFLIKTLPASLVLRIHFPPTCGTGTWSAVARQPEAAHSSQCLRWAVRCLQILLLSS